ncbi:MAG: hypothetical protein R2731_12980 [Nocardioides sp.]
MALIPNLCLLVVVGVGLRHGPTTGALTGFGVGVLVDLAPPADHTAGRWALALLVAGALAGRLADQLPSQDGPSPRRTLVLVVAGCSFVASSTYALTGRLLGDLQASVPGLLAVIALAVLADTVAAAPLHAVAGATADASRPRAVGPRRRRPTRPGAAAPAGRDPGPGLLALRHARGPAVLPAGAGRLRLPGRGRVAVGA